MQTFLSAKCSQQAQTSTESRARFVALAREMLALQQAWIGAGEDAWGEWDDLLPGAQACDQGVWTFALPCSSSRGAVMSQVVRAANRLGLTVHDERLELVHLPSGRRLPQARRVPWDAEGRAQDTQQTFLRLRQRFGEALQMAGFGLQLAEAEFAQFERRFSESRQVVTLEFHDVGDDLSALLFCQVGARVFNDPIEQLARCIHGPVAEGEVPDPHLVFNIGTGWEYPAYGMPIDTPVEQQHLASLLRSELLPMLDLARSLRGLERMMNEHSTWELGAPNCLQTPGLATYLRQDRKGYAVMAAWLVVNPQLSQVCERRRVILDCWGPGHRPDLDRVFTYIRNQPG